MVFERSGMSGSVQASADRRVRFRRVSVTIGIALGAVLATVFLLALTDGFFVGSDLPHPRLETVEPIGGAPPILRSATGSPARRERGTSRPGPRPLALAAGSGVAAIATAGVVVVRTRTRNPRARSVRHTRSGSGRRGPSRLRRRVAVTSGWGALGLIAVSVFAGLWAWHHLAATGRTLRPDSDRAGYAPPELPPGTGSVIDATDPVTRSARPYRRTVALTFEGGPDPRWTPEVLDVLQAHDVPGTFFLIGRNVVQHPGLARRETNEGHETGLLSFDQVDLAAVSAEEMNRELRLTQAAITGATGRQSVLLRPPYVGSAALVGSNELDVSRRAADLGYLTVLTDHDSGDWRRDAVSAIVRRAMPEDGLGGIITFRDGGKDRQQTVAALSALIVRLRSDGYRFVTVSELARVPSVVRSAPPLAHARGVAILTSLRVGRWLTEILGVVIGFVTAVAVVRILVLSLFAVRQARRERRSPLRRPRLDPVLPIPVTVIVPAHNEASSIERTVRALLASSHPQFEVIVVDDGSDDATAAVVRAIHDHRLSVLSISRRGKAAALNTALLRARNDVVVTIDADTIVEWTTIEHLARPFQHPDVGAASGFLMPQRGDSVLSHCQYLEYLMGSQLDRRAFDLLGSTGTVPGAVGAYRRRAVEEVGGFSGATLAEDTDLTLALGRAGWKIRFVADAPARTEAPTTWRGFWQQRTRWSLGILQCSWLYTKRGNGNAPWRWRTVTLPSFVVFHALLPLSFLALDLAALYGLATGQLGPLVIWSVFTVAQFVGAFVALRLAGERYPALIGLPLQYFVFRQALALLVLQSATKALVGAAEPWSRAPRVSDQRGRGGAGAELTLDISEGEEHGHAHHPDERATESVELEADHRGERGEERADAQRRVLESVATGQGLGGVERDEQHHDEETLLG